MTDLLAVYDQSLRGTAELAGATDVVSDGLVLRGRYDDHGFATARALETLTPRDLDDLIARTRDAFAAMPGLVEAEWKTRGHDLPADLGERLEAHGFEPDEVETVMLGEASALTGAPDVPGVTVRRVDDAPDRVEAITAAALMQAEVFGGGPSPESVLARLARDADNAEFWVAEVDGAPVSAGRLEFVPGTEVAGLWGGATLPEWRGRGVYRALTAARARSTLARGYRYLHSDCTPMSRPILERAGLVAVTTTTPYVWRP